jgi:hypothetical protein
MSFQDYYKYYLTLHQNPWNRFLHVVGQLATIAYVMWVVSSGYWILLLAAPFVVYPFAWSGHVFFEKNTPAAWSRPLWAKACDWVMLKDILLRRI